MHVPIITKNCIKCWSAPRRMSISMPMFSSFWFSSVYTGRMSFELNKQQPIDFMCCCCSFSFCIILQLKSLCLWDVFQQQFQMPFLCIYVAVCLLREVSFSELSNDYTNIYVCTDVCMCEYSISDCSGPPRTRKSSEELNRLRLMEKHIHDLFKTKLNLALFKNKQNYLISNITLIFRLLYIYSN